MYIYNCADGGSSVLVAVAEFELLPHTKGRR